MAKALGLMCCCVLMAVVHEQVLMAPAMASRALLDEEFGGQKNYYSSTPTPTDPHHSPTPTDPHHSPTPTDPHPSTPTYPHHSPTHSHKTPSCSPTPARGGTLPTTPSSPHAGGGYYPPTPPTATPTPLVPVTPPYTPTPLVPVSPPYTPTPLVPVSPIGTPPTPFLPLVPTPPSSPTPFDPNSPPFFTGTCDFWRSHPAAIWALFGFWCPVGTLFGPTAASAFGRDLSVPEALANTRADGVGALYREGTASLLNSMVNSRFPFTTQQVKGAFGAALRSGDHAAAAQAQLFKKANEGHLKH